MPDVPPTLQEKLALMGLPQAYRSILLSLSTTAPPSTLASKKQIYLHAAAVLQSLSATHNSASKIQSITRGKTARKSVSVKKLDNARQSDAAIKLQSIQRGRQGRYHHLNERKKRDDFAKVRMQAEQHVAEQKEQHLATTKLQAIQRGRMGRKESIRKKDDKHSADVNGEKGAKAATILQNVHRRKSAVAITSKMKEEKELEAGARKIQSLQRARTGKKEFEEKQGAVAKLQAAERGRMGRKKAKAATSEYKSAAILQARKRGADGRVEARQVARARAMEPVGDGMIHIGDVVKARIAGEPLWCEGIVIGRSGEGNIEEFDIDFGDGEVQEHVPMKSIRKIFHWSTLEIGDHVKAPVPGFAFMKADAEVVVYEGDAGGVARYTIKFDDGEIAEGVPVGDLIKATSSRTKAVLMWRKGFQTVMARVDYMLELLADAKAKGGEIVGGSVVGGPASTLMAPGIVYGVTEGMRLYSGEQFGPIVAVAFYEELDEIVGNAKESIYAQLISLFTAGRRSSAMGTMSVDKALEAFAVETVVSAKREREELRNDVLARVNFAK